MENNMNSALAISDILMDAINKKYDSVRDLNSIKVNISEEGFDDMNPVIDSIIEEENNHIGKLQQLVDLLSGGEEEIAEGKEETIEMIDNSDEFMESMTTMKKKLRLSENFDNVIDDVQAVADPIFVGANEEHDENKKNFESAIKENEKEAKETIPKEGDTGKKVTSAELKKMKLSESAFDESLEESIQMGIAKEQLRKFAEGKMPSNWTINGYLGKLNEDKHLSDDEVAALKEWFINEGTVSRNDLKNEHPDLSRVEGSMTSVIESNTDLINSATSPAQLAEIMKELFAQAGIFTPASERLLANIKKQRNIVGAWGVVYNSALAGENNRVIR